MISQSSSFNELVTSAREAERDGRLEIAADVWNEIRVRFPESSIGFASGGRLLKRLGRLPEALAVLGQGLDRFPKDEWLSVENAWALCEAGDFARAARCFREIREIFPGALAAYLGGAVAHRRAGEFEEAETLYTAAFTRFTDNLSLFRDYAWTAEERRDIPEAIRRWGTVQAQFPDDPIGHIRGGVLLLHSHRFDEADRVLGEAVRRFPESEEALTSYAWVAHNQHNWPEALKRWEQVIAKFPQLRDPRRLATQVLMDLGRFDEARTVLAPALRMFPDDRAIAIVSGWLATRRRDILEADRIWGSVRDRFPDCADGYRGHALALREVGRLDEAEAMLLEGARRFPLDSVIAMDLALIPERKHNWSLASERWRGVRSRFPDLVEAQIGLGNSLLREGNASEAAAVYEEGLRRFPDDIDMAAAQARLAAGANDWPRALELWTAVKDRFADSPAGSLGLGQTLRDCGELERSVNVLGEALRRFAGDIELEVQLALTLSAQRLWPQALARWESLKRRFPNNTDVRWGISQILDKALSDQAAGHGEPFEIPQIVLATEADDSEYVKALSTLFKRFESLGDTCEFGMVQRIFQVDQVSLLRWAATTPENLVIALDDRFSGVGDPEHTIIAINGDEYTTEDRRYLMHSHTFTSPNLEPIELFAPEQCRRLQWLRRKLIDNLTSAGKIFVYKYEDGLTDSNITALYEALRRYCPDIVLVCIKLEEAGHRSGTVESIRGGLFVGYLDRFSTVDISVSGWISVCQAVAQRLPTGTTRIEVPEP
jgi:tetratricopeptide (TPR) repeat protein